MKPAFYEELQHNFITVRYMQYPDAYDKEVYDQAINAIREARQKIEMHSIPSEKKVLLYCIDTLFDVLAQDDPQKRFDFADTIHNIPEIYTGRREQKSFNYEIKAFRKKYGEEYFPFFDEKSFRKKGPRPYFCTTMPKNASDFFFAESDEDFKALYPKGYWVLVSIGIFVSVLPIFTLAIYVDIINPAPDSTNWISGICGLLGPMIIGIGLFNIVAAWIHQYLGHIFTVVCLALGSALTWLCLYLTYR